MKNAHLIISKDFIIGKTDDRLFGSFVEHMGSVVYNGIFEPNHPLADEKGFRKDVLELVKKLQLSVIRYPGGNFTSGYNWEDTVGPVNERPTKLDLAWRAYEPNTFGLDEFLTWIKEVKAQPIMTINLGTRGIDSARNIIEYCNFPGGAYWSDLRIKHGIREPYKIKTWCLGNELDGEWQIARKTADEYGRLACEAGKVMKLVDPEIELVAVGSSARHLASFPEWDQTVLMHTYNQVDYISLHHYINKKTDSTKVYLARPIDVEKQINEVIAACDYVKGIKRSNKVMYLSFDEWNVHKNPQVAYKPWTTGSPFDWCCFNILDTLVFGSMMLAILRHADRIKIACQSLLVNTIPLILTEKGGLAWCNPTYYPMMHVSMFGRGDVLVNNLDTPTYSTEEYGEVPGVDCVTVINKEKGELTVFAISRLEDEIMLSTHVKENNIKRVIEHIVLTHNNLEEVNTADNPHALVPNSMDHSQIDGNRVMSKLVKYSWNVIRLELI